MRHPTLIEVERGRLAGPSGEPYGQFAIKVGPFRLNIIASAGQGWDHASVSLPNRCPTWAEMDAIKRLFWWDHEVVMQLHIHTGDKVNIHPHCLHLWRPQTKVEIDREKRNWLENGEPNVEWHEPTEIPLPPKEFV